MVSGVSIKQCWKNEVEASGLKHSFYIKKLTLQFSKKVLKEAYFPVKTGKNWFFVNKRVVTKGFRSVFSTNKTKDDDWHLKSKETFKIAITCE